MAKDSAAARPAVEVKGRPLDAQVIDIRTRRPYRPSYGPVWPFFIDMVIAFTVVLLGTWLFHKMRGG